MGSLSGIIGPWIRVFAAAVLAIPILAVPGTVRSQVSQQDLAQIRERIAEGLRQAMQNAPEKTAQIPGLTIRWRAVPTDPTEIMRQYGGLPQGVNVESLARQYQSDISRILNENLTDVAVLEVEGRFLGPKKLGPGKYFLGVEAQGLAPARLIVREYLEPTEREREQDPQAKPHAGRPIVPLQFLKRGDLAQPSATLEFEIREIPKKEGQYTLWTAMYKTEALTQPFKVEVEAKTDGDEELNEVEIDEDQ